MGGPMNAALLEVDLPCCEVCGLVGKIPTGASSGRNTCVGPVGARHKRTTMKVRRFVEKPRVPERRSRAPG